MRRLLATFVGAIALLGVASDALAAKPHGLDLKALRRALNSDLSSIGGADGAYVVDLTTGRALFYFSARTERIPASLQKLYTTTTALLRLGPAAVLKTSVLGTGAPNRAGTWKGTIYLRGGGDPSFGSARFDEAAYGTGATIQALARAVRGTGIRRIVGRIVGDESRFDARRGTPATDYKRSYYLEGQLSALAYDRGFANAAWTRFQTHPALFAARHFAAALRAVGIAVPSSVRISTGVTPADASPIASVNSPPVAKLIELTNTPSDNFFAEMLLKNLGADFGGKGSTAAGVKVVRGELARRFGLHPRFDDGSGLSRYDATSPMQVVRLLRRMAGDPYFTHSLAIAGETGTLIDEMRDTRAQGRCLGKTGTLYDVASLAGYCTARDGHTLTFAFMLNQIANPDTGHAVEANMAVALANFDGKL